MFYLQVQDKTVQAKVKSITVQQNIASLVVRTLLQPFLIFINYFKKHVLKIQDKDNNTELSRLTSDTSIGKM